jgi:hypothetical protein
MWLVSSPRGRLGMTSTNGYVKGLGGRHHDARGFNSLGGEVLEKSLQVLKPGGKLISISGPPDSDFAKDMGSSWILRQFMRLLSYRIRKKAKRHRVSYSFLFMPLVRVFLSRQIATPPN